MGCFRSIDSVFKRHLLLVFGLFVLLDVSVCRSADPVLNLIGDRSFRANGLSILPVVVTEKYAVVADAYGELTAFELASGNVSSVTYAKTDDNEYVADVAHSPDGQLFAIAIGRRIEVRKSDNPEQVVATYHLSKVSSDDYYVVPNAEIEFDPDGKKLIAYDKVGSKLLEFSLSTGESRTIAQGVAGKVSYRLSVSPSQHVWLTSSQEIICIKKDELPKRFPVQEKNLVASLTATESSVFIVYDVLSTKLFGPSARILVEHDADSFDKRNRWECDSKTIAIVNRRPVFQKGGSLCIGTEDGKTREVANCGHLVKDLMVSTAGSHLVASLTHGICIWDTDTWNPNVQISNPYQDDLLFAVSNQGILTAVTEREIWQSDGGGQFSVRSQLQTEVPQVIHHRSLSANGEVLAYIDRNDQVHIVNLSDSNSTLLEVPDHGRAKFVCLDESGSIVAVQYSPPVPNAADANANATTQEFLHGVTDGMKGTGGKSSNEKNACSIFKLPSGEPIANGVIGRIAMLNSHSGYHLSSETGLFWMGSHSIGNWRFRDGSTKAKSRSTGTDETMGFCAFNSHGDAICRKVGREQGVADRIVWYGTSQRRPIELAVVKKQPDSIHSSYVAALAEDQDSIYLGESSGYRSTISKITLPSKEVVWTIPLPSRLMNIRLSPDNRFLGAKLSDSRYAIIAIGD